VSRHIDPEIRRPEPSLPLFDVAAHSRKSDPQTSFQAAAMVSGFAHSHCQKILEALRLHGPLGKTRIAAKTGIDHIAVARRLSDLKNANLALPTGDTEKSATGRNEQIWRAL
jgi:hypothetical protein